MYSIAVSGAYFATIHKGSCQCLLGLAVLLIVSCSLSLLLSIFLLLSFEQIKIRFHFSRIVVTTDLCSRRLQLCSFCNGTFIFAVFFSFPHYNFLYSIAKYEKKHFECSITFAKSSCHRSTNGKKWKSGF